MQRPYPGDGKYQFGLQWWILMFEVSELRVIPERLPATTPSSCLHKWHPRAHAVRLASSEHCVLHPQIFIFTMIFVLLVMPRTFPQHLLYLVYQI